MTLNPTDKRDDTYYIEFRGDGDSLEQTVRMERRKNRASTTADIIDEYNGLATRLRCEVMAALEQGLKVELVQTDLMELRELEKNKAADNLNIRWNYLGQMKKDLEMHPDFSAENPGLQKVIERLFSILNDLKAQSLAMERELEDKKVDYVDVGGKLYPNPMGEAPNFPFRGRYPGEPWLSFNYPRVYAFLKRIGLISAT